MILQLHDYVLEFDYETYNVTFYHNDLPKEVGGVLTVNAKMLREVIEEFEASLDQFV